jgi:hypothetical protein
MEKFNIIVTNESGERVYPQGVDWDKWLKRLKKGLDWLKIAMDIYIVLRGFGGSGGGFRVMSITIVPSASQIRN